MDLIEFLRERLDEDEQTARAQRVPHDWHQGPGDDPEWTTAEMVCMWPPEFHTPYEQDKHWRGITVEGPELAAHIARHDPARVLREVEAKRNLVAELDEVVSAGTASDGYLDHEYGQEAATLRNVLRELAAVYAGHPDYREEWRP